MASGMQVRPPSWGVVAVCVLLAAVLAVAAVASTVASAPRRVVPRRRVRYVGAHSDKRVAA